uniref:HUWE1 associated protein modifying stress responses n=1 Tax=Rhinolophus ferrumequinum TaxID=59479 RepID=A0A671G7U9_RHIFE
MRVLRAGAPQSGRGSGAKWAVLLSQHVGGGGRGPAAAKASTVPATTFLSLRVCPSCAGRPVRRARLSPAATLGGPRRHGGAVVGLGTARRGRWRSSGRGDLQRGPGVGRSGAGVVPGSAGPRGGARRPSGSRRPGLPRGAAAGRWTPPPGHSTTTLPRETRLRRTRRRRRRGRGRPRRMEERKEEGEAEIQEHGPEHWFSKWERQCLAEAEQDEQLPPELQEEAAAAAQPEHKQQKLWHLFQNSATAVAQLYKDRVCQQPGLSLWVPFQNAATAVTNLYKESVDTHQRSFDIGIQIGYQRRNKDVLAWVKKRRRTIRREDLISFLCGKVPPPRNSRAPPRLTVVSPNRATSTETSSSVETDLQPFREAIALHGLSGAMASISVRSSTPGSPTHVSSGSNASRRRNGLHDVDLNTFISEEMALHLDNGGTRKRTSAQCGDVITDSPTHKRNRMI